MSKDKFNPAAATEKALNKYRKRMWKFCKCGTFWLFMAILCIAIGIALLVVYAKHWTNQEEWRRGLAYFGVALLLLGLCFVAVSVVLCTVLCVIWRRLDTGHYDNPTWFKPPVYEYGKAPYPQQPPATIPEGSPAASAPLNPNVQPTDPGKVDIEIAEHHKF